MKYPAYPNYKDSGVEWLGDLPEHWKVVPFKHLCRRSALYGANISSDEYVQDGVRFLRTTDITELGTVEPEGVFIEPQQAAGYILSDGDILLSRSGTLGRAFVHRSDEHPTAAYAGYLVRFVPSASLNPQFFFYFSKSVPFTDWLQTQVIASTIGNVNGQKYAQCLLPCPKRIEQDAIANFLDAATAKLDTLVAKKRELIEKLKEKRTALISRTVTRGLPPEAARSAGLNPYPRLKPSGIEWLGEIPEHWGVVPLKWHAHCSSGDSIQTDDVSSVASDEASIPVIGGNGVMGYANRSNTALVVLAIGRVGALCGNVHLVEPPAWITDNALVLEWALPTFDPRFIAAVLASRNLNDLAAKTAQPLITGSQVSDQRVPKPDLIEQRAIADFLDRETEKIDQMVAKVEAAIERLLEYRTALITAAVTGKIDVRTKH